MGSKLKYLEGLQSFYPLEKIEKKCLLWNFYFFIFFTLISLVSSGVSSYFVFLYAGFIGYWMTPLNCVRNIFVDIDPFIKHNKKMYIVSPYRNGAKFNEKEELIFLERLLSLGLRFLIYGIINSMLIAYLNYNATGLRFMYAEVAYLAFFLFIMILDIYKIYTHDIKSKYSKFFDIDFYRGLKSGIKNIIYGILLFFGFGFGTYFMLVVITGISGIRLDNSGLLFSIEKYFRLSYYVNVDVFNIGTFSYLVCSLTLITITTILYLGILMHFRNGLLPFKRDRLLKRDFKEIEQPIRYVEPKLSKL